MKNTFLICGNKYDSDRALEELLSKCGVKDVMRVNDFLSLEDVCSEMCSSDMFSEKRVIVLNQIPKKMATEIVPFLEKIPKSNIVVFVSYESLKTSRKFCNFFKKNKCLYEFDFEVKNPSIIVGKRLEELGKKASPEVIDHFVDTVGSDIGIVLSEVDKLCTYVGTRNVVKKEDIDEVCCSSQNFVIWDFLNSLSVKNKRASCRVLANANECGFEYEFLLAMLIRAIRLALFL